MYHIMIEGFMGSGKGTIARRVATEKGLPLVDIDKKVSDRLHMTPSEIYDRFGDVYYRAMETFILSELEKETERMVIILGSGLPTIPQNAKYLKKLGIVYYLQTDKSMIFSRLERGKKSDWLEDKENLREKVVALLTEREPSYLAVADVVIEAKKRTVADIVAELVARVDDDLAAREAADEEDPEKDPAEAEAAAAPETAAAPVETPEAEAGEVPEEPPGPEA